jgi:hypothetical protein
MIIKDFFPKGEGPETNPSNLMPRHVSATQKLPRNSSGNPPEQYQDAPQLYETEVNQRKSVLSDHYSPEGLQPGEEAFYRVPHLAVQPIARNTLPWHLPPSYSLLC